MISISFTKNFGLILIYKSLMAIFRFDLSDLASKWEYVTYFW